MRDETHCPNCGAIITGNTCPKWEYYKEDS